LAEDVDVRIYPKTVFPAFLKKKERKEKKKRKTNLISDMGTSAK
jgi:hypothetical protein